MKGHHLKHLNRTGFADSTLELMETEFLGLPAILVPPEGNTGNRDSEPCGNILVTAREMKRGIYYNLISG